MIEAPIVFVVNSDSYVSTIAAHGPVTVYHDGQTAGAHNALLPLLQRAAWAGLKTSKDTYDSKAGVVPAAAKEAKPQIKILVFHD